MFLSRMSGDADVDEITSVANEVKLVLGTNRTPVGAEVMTQPTMAAENFPIITKRTALAALATVLTRFDAVLGSLDWLLARLKPMSPPGEPSLEDSRNRWAEVSLLLCERVPDFFHHFFHGRNEGS